MFNSFQQYKHFLKTFQDISVGARKCYCVKTVNIVRVHQFSTADNFKYKAKTMLILKPITSRLFLHHIFSC